jgi:diguanylate cyclase (GGDEF)-like protein/PAS domain S-box-containing protein
MMVVTGGRPVPVQGNADERDFHPILRGALDALPAHIAILNAEGTIIAVNAAWRYFAHENGYADPHAGVGANYLGVCDRATGDDVTEARQMAAGIRRVLSGDAKTFMMEYPCDAPDRERWFSARITRLAGDGPAHAIVAHEEITARVRAERDSRASEARYRHLVEQSPEAILIQCDGYYVAANPAAIRLLGGERSEDIVGRSLLDFVLPEDMTAVRERMYRRANGEQVEIIPETRRRRLDGETLILDHFGIPTMHQGRHAMVTIYRDITARKRAEDDLRESEMRYRLLFYDNPQPMWVYNTETLRFLNVNDAAIAHYGFTRDEFLAMTLADIHLPEDMRALRASLAVPPTTLRASEWRHRTKTGALIDVHVATHSLRHDTRPARLALVTDITDRKRLDAQHLHSASHDPLTDLPNRALFMRELAASFERVRHGNTARYAVIFIDLDRFKQANDSFGHIHGDHLLIAITERLRACMPENAILARLAGDEFAVLLREIPAVDAAVAVAQRIHTALEPPLLIRGQEMYLTASIGIAPGDGSYAQAEDVLRDADAAMYQAKARGKARHVVFDTKMRTDARISVQRESALRRAVEHGEFEACYQPIVAMNTGRALGFEALVRWRRPAGDLVLPAEFVPLAEETGVIVAIDRWMLREACEQLRRWDARFPDDERLGMGVNISGTHLAQADFVAQVEAVLTETGIDPARLRLEITESVLIERTEVAAAAFCQLRSLGVRIVLDDFGVGYSSLNHLRQFPIDTVKIDRSFARGMEANRVDAAIVRSLIALAHTLGLRTVAEGIEADAQVQRLCDIDCDYGQGNYFARPMSAAEAEHYLDTTWRASGRTPMSMMAPDAAG